MKTGLEVFLTNDLEQYANKKIGLLTNVTGVNRNLESTIDLFHKHLNLCALFAPEHGIRADLKEGEEVGDTIDEITGVPIYSLYGKSKEPKEEHVQNIDVIFIDIQDIGTRYYTFIYTMAYVMEVCKQFGKEVVVLDRPNPINGIDVEGNLVEKGFTSFVGLYPIPNRHGMTIGELALLFNEHFKIGCELRIIKMERWHRVKFFDDLNIPWVPPSPNVTGTSMQLLYPGTCLVEGTNVSEGRGTVRPFEIIGAPFIDARELAHRFNDLRLRGVKARPVSFVPTYQKYVNEKCYGVQLHVLNRNEMEPVKVGIKLIELIYNMYTSEFQFLLNDHIEHPFFDLLAGTDQLRKSIMDNSTDSYLKRMEEDRLLFLPIRERHLIYE